MRGIIFVGFWEDLKRPEYCRPSEVANLARKVEVWRQTDGLEYRGQLPGLEIKAVQTEGEPERKGRWFWSRDIPGSDPMYNVYVSGTDPGAHLAWLDGREYDLAGLIYHYAEASTKLRLKGETHDNERLALRNARGLIEDSR